MLAKSELPRLVKEVILLKGFLICEFCTKDCQIVRQNFSKTKDADIYKTLRKDARNGDQVELPNRQYLLPRRVVLPPNLNDDTRIRQKLQNISEKIGYTKELGKDLKKEENHLILEDINE